MKSSSKIVATLVLALTVGCGAESGEDGSAKTTKDADKAGDLAKAGDAEKPAHAEKGDTDAKPAQVEAGGRIEISVDAGGYHPAQIQAPAKSKVTLAFKRVSDVGCGQELVVASMDLKKQLPLNEIVEIEVETGESGEIGFACGMDMYKGKVVIR